MDSNEYSPTLREAVIRLLANVTPDGACQANLYDLGIIDDLRNALESTPPDSASTASDIRGTDNSGPSPSS
jgi:hypothetical protein